MAARLILATGSRAGLEAPLQFGYYMIGRHTECQIRPKSRSVSRRHCLMHLDESGVRVLDLSSSSGTYVSGEKLKPRTWVTLNDGETLRCGKIQFRLSLPSQEKSGSIEREPREQVAAVAETRTGSMLSGDAWQDADVASFLDLHDDADRERRYGTIRAKHAAADVDRQDSDSDVDVDLFEDAFDEDFVDPPLSPARGQNAGQDVVGGMGDSEGSESEESESEEIGSEKPRKSAKVTSPRRPPGLPKKMRAPRSSWGGVSWSLTVDADRWKLIAATLVTAAVLGFCCYEAYQFYSGPSVRVLQDID